MRSNADIARELREIRADLEATFCKERDQDRLQRNPRAVCAALALEAERVVDEARIRGAIDDVLFALERCMS